ncbi:MAG: aldehyde dehydrogenase family protein [Syntrophobacteraceae bacterium]|jgi:succinate-semialdehyde dehydrogenase
MTADKYVATLVETSRSAQKKFESYNQEQVDQVVRAVGKAVYDHGEGLARMAVEETKIGDYNYKVLKNKGKALAVWNYLKNKRSVGIIKYIEDEGLVEVAKSKGVIGCITPVSNPIVTPMHNAMIILKGRNSTIICPHPSAKRSGRATVDFMNAALKELGAPDNLIQYVDEPTFEISREVMKQTDTCVSTGGAGLVKVAYASGKPAYGVGPGNVQCIIDTDADVPYAVKCILTGRAFDNGILCTCEQSAHCHESQFNAVVEEFKKQGTYYVEKPEEVKRLREACFPDGNINRKLVGKYAYEIAETAGLEIGDATVIMVKADGPGKEDLFAKEKMFPVLAIYKYKTWEEAVDNVNANIEIEGKGHSIIIHSHTQDHIEYAALNVFVSRFLVNGIGSLGLGGAYANSLVPTGTVACGSWGNNITTDNIDYTHLINISRIVYTRSNPHIPTPEEIWG